MVDHSDFEVELLEFLEVNCLLRTIAKPSRLNYSADMAIGLKFNSKVNMD